MKNRQLCLPSADNTESLILFYLQGNKPKNKAVTARLDGPCLQSQHVEAEKKNQSSWSAWATQ